MRGFVAVLEVFLAITLLYIVMSQIQINLPAKYSDTANMDRLHRYSHDMAFSLCGSLKAKKMLINDTLNFDLNGSVPTDLGYRVSFYKNSSNSHILDSLVYNYTPRGDLMNGTSVATSSCLIAGGPNATNYAVSTCNNQGSDCLTQISTSDNSRINLLENQNFTVVFSPSKNGSIVEFFLEGYHNQSGTTFLYDSIGNEIASYDFSTSADENHTFDLSDFFPDQNGAYNITVIPTNIDASYDYAYLNVSSNVYAPRRVVVQTWNTGD